MKTTEQISMKLGWRTGLDPEQTPLTFGADPGRRMDEELFLTFSTTYYKLLLPVHCPVEGGST